MDIKMLKLDNLGAGQYAALINDKRVRVHISETTNALTEIDRTVNKAYKAQGWAINEKGLPEKPNTACAGYFSHVLTISRDAISNGEKSIENELNKLFLRVAETSSNLLVSNERTKLFLAND